MPYLAMLERGFHRALEDVQPHRAFIVYGGEERYPKGDNIEAIAPGDLARELADLAAGAMG